ncbi:hypothetical protein AABD41_13155 [Staphylococcus pseudoxylosus]|uniref:hypothetical protein n=1 Tax=Staphylococcus pseudoxylosus TaxID=2282419 RepID=UPI00398B3A34
MKIDILTILIPLLSSSIVACIFIIISFSRDRFLKIIDVNQMFAITKILNFIAFLIVCTSLIVLISLDIVNFDIDQIDNVLYNPKERFTYFTECLTFLTMFIIVYFCIPSYSNKDCYYIENYNNSGKRLYILQKYKDYYICTIDTPNSNTRIIKSTEDITNTKLEYYFNSNMKLFDVSDVFKYKSHKARMFAFFLLNFLLIIISMLLIGTILLLNSFINFESRLAIMLSLILSIYVLLYLLQVLKMNWSKFNTYQANRKK